MIRVLVVEDEPTIARVHAAYVERVPGFAVVATAHTARDAVRLATEHRPDLVLLDLGLPDAGGLDVLRELRDREAGTPGRRSVDVIAVTGQREAETVRAAVSRGVVQYVVKPFAFAALREKLERYATYRGMVGDGEEADQSTVDGMLGALRGSSASPLPRGLSARTLRVITDVVRDARPDALGAAAVAERGAVSRVTARRYLEYLEADGRVAMRPHYGGTGRPEHRYAWIGPAD